MSVFQLFIYSGHHGIVDVLLKNGANINAGTNNNETSLLWAAANGNFQIKRSNNDQKLCNDIIDININFFRTQSSC